MEKVYLKGAFYSHGRGKLLDSINFPIIICGTISNEISYNLTIEKPYPNVDISLVIKGYRDVSPKQFANLNEISNSVDLLRTPFYSPPLNGSSSQALNKTMEEYFSTGQKIFNIVRWHSNLEISQLSLEGLFWSVDNIRWIRYPYFNGNKYILEGMGYIRNVILDETDLKIAIEGEEEEPLYFNLLREGELIINSSQRSAFIMAVTSLEVGTKTLLIKLKPDIEWLLNNVPSPPILKLIQEYLPTLIPELDFRKEVIDDLRNLFLLRNKLVHLGKFNDKNGFNFPSLIKYFDLVNDLLYYYDKFQGHNWIKEGIHIAEPRLKEQEI